MSKTKDGLLFGTILLAVALSSAHATPFDGVLVIAQAPQADQEKEKEKKPPQRPTPPPPGQEQRRERNATRLDDVRGARREVREGDRLLIDEPGRVIIQQGGQTIVRHNEDDRSRWPAQDVHTERRGADTVTVFDRPDGSRIYTVNDESGRLLHRYRRMPDGREIIIIDNRYSGPPNPFGYFVDLPPPVIRIPRERYIVQDDYARPDDIYSALWAGPVDYL